MNSQVGPLSRAKYRKEAQTDYLQTSSMVGGVALQFVRGFSGSIRGKWLIYSIALFECSHLFFVFNVEEVRNVHLNHLVLIF